MQTGKFIILRCCAIRYRTNEDVLQDWKSLPRKHLFKSKN